MYGDQTLERIREQGYDCRVAMVTAVDPDVDIVEMDFDDYLTKPITREEVERTVENLIMLATYDETVSEEFSLAKEQTALETHNDEQQLRDDEQFQELRQRREEIEEEIEDTLEGIGTKRLRAMLESLREEHEE
jgi:DNA-binding response OmpR family regulator